MIGGSSLRRPPVHASSHCGRPASCLLVTRQCWASCRSTLGAVPRPADSMPSGADVIAEDESVLRSEDLSCTVTIVLMRPAGSGGSAVPSAAAAANRASASLQDLEL